MAATTKARRQKAAAKTANNAPYLAVVDVHLPEHDVEPKSVDPDPCAETDLDAAEPAAEGHE